MASFQPGLKKALFYIFSVARKLLSCISKKSAAPNLASLCIAAPILLQIGFQEPRLGPFPCVQIHASSWYGAEVAGLARQRTKLWLRATTFTKPGHEQSALEDGYKCDSEHHGSSIWQPLLAQGLLFETRDLASTPTYLQGANVSRVQQGLFPQVPCCAPRL